MRRLVALPLLGLAFVFAACDERWDYIEGTNPPQFIVYDADGDLDKRVINETCARFGSEVLRTQKTHEDTFDGLVVTCKPNGSTP